MTGPITWAALGALLPLVAAAIAFGKLLAIVSRQGVDYTKLEAGFDGLRREVEAALRVQTRHSEQIKHIQDQSSETQRELLLLLRGHYGVGNTRGSPDVDG